MENKEIEQAVNYFKTGNFITAKKKLSELIEKSPNNHSLHNLLGVVLINQKKFDQAIVSFKESIQINPDFAQGYNNLSIALLALKKFEESINYCQKAIEIEPNYIEAYYNLGFVFKKIGKFKESISNYQRAININPNYLSAYKDLGDIFRKIGDVEGARKYFNKLFELSPSNIEHKINSELLVVPIAYSNEEINFYRNKYEEGLLSLEKYKYTTESPGLLIKSNAFYLSYHNKNNLEIMKKTSILFRKIIPNINFVSKKLNNRNIKKKIKIGFISEYLTEHTIGKLFGGFVKNINKKKFEVIIFHTSKTKKSLVKKEIDESANKVINLNTKITNQQKQIENEDLDIIFYPDIGMSPTTYFLAFSRLAPVQIASYGHPETTGIDTVDYFLSSTLFEPDSKKKYSERLICLNQFPSYYEIPKKIGKLKNRKELKLPEDVKLYGCPQTLFKLHPDFDSIMAKILIGDPKSYIVLIGGDGKKKYWVEKLKKRWAKNFSILNERVFFTKKLSQLEFISLCDCVDVLLDPFYFGGGNSVLEALSVGTPTVTMPNEYLRTNVAAAAYKQMKISSPPIAQSSKEYIDLAIQLAQKNNQLRDKLKAAANKYLFKNSKALNEFESFLEKVHLDVKNKQW
jgi:predicted O-linked N-acetylglucosamine transferase (SPINDLY family)